MKLCISNCPCPEFSMPPRTMKDYFDEQNYHLHDGCRVVHDRKICPAPQAQGELFDGRSGTVVQALV
jgi:hypothetical protein